MRSERRIKQQHRKRRTLKSVLLTLGTLLFFAAGAFAGYYGSLVLNFIDDVSVTDQDVLEPDGNIDERIANGEPFSVLILGTDVEDDGIARSDSIIVTTVNPKENTVKMLSVPRDTFVTLPTGVPDKINAAYAIGEVAMTRQAVSDYLDIPLDFYAILDFDGLIELVDATGGVTVNSELDFDESDYRHPGERIEIKKGKQRLNGDEALAYARMRYQDERGDFGRQDRQKEVVISLVKELASLNSLANMKPIFDAIRPYLKTNISSTNFLAIANKYNDASRNIEQVAIDGPDGQLQFFPQYGMELWTWQAYDDSLLEMRNELRSHLGLTRVASLEDTHHYQYYLPDEDILRTEQEETEQYSAPSQDEDAEDSSDKDTDYYSWAY